MNKNNEETKNLSEEEMEKEYQDKRERILSDLEKIKYQNNTITEKDNQANKLYKEKVKPTFKFKEDFYYYLSMKYKKEIETHEFFKDISKMPKGALLHHHFCDSIDVDWIAKEVMKPENLPHIYVRKFLDKYDILIFTKKPKTTGPEFDKPFRPIIEEYLNNQKKENNNINENKIIYDFFEEKLTFLPWQIEHLESNDDLWKAFMPKYYYCQFLIKNERFFRMHLRNIFLQCHKDNQERIETRYFLGELYDDEYNGTISNEMQMEIIKEELEKFRKEINNEDFSLGLIILMRKNWEDKQMIDTIKEAQRLKRLYPELICAIDMSGDENNFRKLYDLHKVIKENNTEILPWIFHCGETLFKENYNCIDALLSNSKRLGHGINLIKHLPILEKIKEKDIVIEINPISNQTLRQVRDIRIHPGIAYHSYGVKIVIGSDDPTLYYTKGVNYDFFVSAVAMEFDLIDLKIIILNSIYGSEVSEEIKKKLVKKFEKKWEEFIENFIKKYF